MHSFSIPAFISSSNYLNIVMADIGSPSATQGEASSVLRWLCRPNSLSFTQVCLYRLPECQCRTTIMNTDQWSPEDIEVHTAQWSVQICSNANRTSTCTKVLILYGPSDIPNESYHCFSKKSKSTLQQWYGVNGKVNKRIVSDTCINNGVISSEAFGFCCSWLK